MENVTTQIFKGRDGWEARTMTATDANGKAWQISTYKTRKGVSCKAIQGQDEGDGAFSYDLFGGKSLELATQEGQCNENKVKAVHAAGLAEFERIMSEQAQTAPAYVVGVGQVVFTDFVHSESDRRVIYEVERPGHFKTVTLDGKQLHRDDRVKNYAEKFGIGVYYNEGEILALEQVQELVKSATAYTQQENEREAKAAEVARAERMAKIEKGAKIIAAIPAGVTHVIVAEHEENESDLQSDYLGSRTTETIYLSWSKHGRDLFPEMRKAAAKFEHTAHLAEAPQKPEGASEYWTAPDEHREKYSMGAGYYLGRSRYSGWNISKSNIDARSLESLQIAAAEGRFLCLDAEVITETDNIAPVEVKKGGVSIIEYGKGLAVIGDTKPIKEQLKSLGGRFNFRLTCGAGWVFSSDKLEAIKQMLLSVKGEAKEEAAPLAIASNELSFFDAVCAEIDA